MNKHHVIEKLRRWLGPAVLTILLGAGALCVSGADAFAHASLVRVEPADGSVIETAPKSFALTFNEPTSPLVLKLVRPDSSIVALDRVVLRDTTLDIEAPAGLRDGSYVLSWRVISEDGHPVGGSAVFSIGAPSVGVAPASTGKIDWPVRIAIWIAKVALYVGLFIGVGGVFFTNWIGGRSRVASHVAGWTILVGLIAAMLSVGLQGLDGLGVPLSSLAKWVVWATGLSTTYGMTALVAAAALVAGLVSLQLNGATARSLSLLALIAVGLALAASGHASAAHPQGLTRPVVFLHGVGIAFWVGSLAPLGATLSLRSREAPTIVHRFSRAIPFAVVPLVAGGVLLAFVQVQSLHALWTTAYGQILLIKLALLLALFLLAIVNRFRLTEPAERGDTKAVLQLCRAIRFELILVLAIFSVAAVWRFTPPPRALAEATAAPVSMHIHTNKAMADLTITPGHAGPVDASIMIMTGDFGPLDAKEVTLVLSNPAAGIEQIKRPARKADDGTWRIDDLNLPLSGRWSVRLDILVSDFELMKLEDKVEIRP